MDLRQISPDTTIFWQWSFVKLNATIVYTWGVMGMLAVGAFLITRRLSTSQKVSRWQTALEMLVDFTRKQVRDIARRDPRPYVPFIGTLFLFIGVANVVSVVPGYESPTASLSTTVALSLCVLLAVPVFGISQQGVLTYLKHYVQPNPFMLPFNIIGELSRTLALAVRLFGNMMSGSKIVAVLLVVAPLIFPVFMNLLGLLTGVIQAYIFAILAMVYIASGIEAQPDRQNVSNENAPSGAAAHAGEERSEA